MCILGGFQGIHGDAPSHHRLQSAATPQPIAGQEAGQWISLHTELNSSRTSQTARQYAAAAVPGAAASTAQYYPPRNSSACWQCHAFSTLLYSSLLIRLAAPPPPRILRPEILIKSSFSAAQIPVKKSSAIIEIHTQPNLRTVWNVSTVCGLCKFQKHTTSKLRIQVYT